MTRAFVGLPQPLEAAAVFGLQECVSRYASVMRIGAALSSMHVVGTPGWQDELARAGAGGEVILEGSGADEQLLVRSVVDFLVQDCGAAYGELNRLLSAASVAEPVSDEAVAKAWMKFKAHLPPPGPAAVPKPRLSVSESLRRRADRPVVRKLLIPALVSLVFAATFCFVVPAVLLLARAFPHGLRFAAATLLLLGLAGLFVWCFVRPERLPVWLVSCAAVAGLFLFVTYRPHRIGDRVVSIRPHKPHAIAGVRRDESSGWDSTRSNPDAGGDSTFRGDSTGFRLPPDRRSPSRPGGPDTPGDSDDTPMPVWYRFPSSARPRHVVWDHDTVGDRDPLRGFPVRRDYHKK